MGPCIGSSGGVHLVSFLGFLVLEPEEMQGKTGRLHGPAFASWWMIGLEATCMMVVGEGRWWSGEDIKGRAGSKRLLRFWQEISGDGESLENVAERGMLAGWMWDTKCTRLFNPSSVQIGPRQPLSPLKLWPSCLPPSGGPCLHPHSLEPS